MNDWTYLDWHKGLGDSLICNGLVRYLIKKGERLILPCFPHNEPSVRAMFADILEDQLSFIRDINTLSIGGNIRNLSLGFGGKNFDGYRWDESFYRQAGVPFREKWESFRIPYCGKLIYPIQCGIPFVHDDKSRGYVIKLPTPRTGPHGCNIPITHFAATLMHAREIHCINSSFAILADLLQCPGKLFLHAYARPNSPLPIFGQHWTVLSSPEEIPS